MKDFYSCSLSFFCIIIKFLTAVRLLALSPNKKHYLYRFLFTCLFLFSFSKGTPVLAQPTGFIDEKIGSNWNAAVGIEFSKDGNSMYVWEKGGKVWIVENGQKLQTPLIDISEEVGDWRDHGLLGFALDPNFESNGYFYLLYVVDRHHLLHYGTGTYDPAANDYSSATIGRLTRYTASAGSNRKSADLNSRKILIGESVSTGIPVLYIGHGVGSVVFGEDGSLLLSTGDGASAGHIDTGYDPSKPNDTYVPQAIADGIISEKENIGSYRAQQVESLNGKILRIDPATGNGLPDNPFYNSADPRSAASRVWALGFRNPFRFSIKPGTGNSGFPGVLYIGDVGWYVWEEINISTKGGQNFGWPIYEGLEPQEWYYHRQVPNKFAPNPLYGKNGCTQQYFYYGDMIKQPKRTVAPYWGNPCDYLNTPIPDSYPLFVHTRPAFDWRQENRGGGSRAGTWNGEYAAVALIGASDSPVSGPQFSGSSVTGGIWYTGDDFPAEYKNTYFFGDYAAGWIKSSKFDGSHNPKSISDFINNDAFVVAFATNPVTGGLYYIKYATEVHKVTYKSGNLPPNAVASADKLSGASPLTVKFTGTNSTDPEGKTLKYEWNFGDGSAVSNDANPTHTFTSTGEANFTVTLKVTDPEGLTSTAQLTISLNNTAPVVKITSPAAGTKYPLSQNTVYNLTADVTDKEHTGEQLTYEWQTVLHHNQHTHPEAIDNKVSTTTTITPVGCDGETYFYRIHLKVTDAGGLSGADFVDVHPDCSGGTTKPIAIKSPTEGASFTEGNNVPLEVSFAEVTRNWTKVEYFQGQTKIAESTSNPFAATWNNIAAGTYSIKAKATDEGGHIVESEAVTITVTKPVNLAPKAVASADKLSGASPLTVKFTGSNSTDPEGKPLQYEWNFGDGSAVSTAANPTHTFTSTGSATFTITLKVTDAGGLNSTAQLTVRIENTAPVVKITSPAAGTKYPLSQNTVYNLTADVTDEEHTGEQLTYEWHTVLHHNQHTHPEAIDNKVSTTTTITPVGCDGETYFYRIHLKVTDAGGLSGADFVDLYPDCSGGTVKPIAIKSPTDGAVYAAESNIVLEVDLSGINRNWTKVAYYQGQTKIAESDTRPFRSTWQNVAGGSYTLKAIATDTWNHTVETAPVSISVTEKNISEGSITREYWANANAASVTNVPLAIPPTSVSELANFQAPSFIADNYTQRLRGFVTAPVSGQYTFWIAADDEAELWLSTSEFAGLKRKIAQVDSRTNSNEWTKFTGQQSVKIALEAGKRYYIEAKHREQDGDDNLSVGWQLPDGTMERPIPGKRLSPYKQNTSIAKEGVMLYPNPFSDELVVEFTEPLEELQNIFLYDASGKVVYKQTDNIQVRDQILKLNLKENNLSPGLYILRLIDSTGKSKVIKVQKM